MEELPVKEFRRLDLNSEEMGVPVAQLMENAGRALAEAAEALEPAGKIVVLCGKGNNGGDGYAAAHFLRQAKRELTVIAVEDPVGLDSQNWRKKCGPVESWDGTIPGCALIVDCLLGSGLTGPPRSPYDNLIGQIAASKAAVLSCDVPSGLGTGVAVRPDQTITFHAAKAGMNRENSGDIILADIGIPPAAETDIGFGDLWVGYPRASAASHKGQNGRVLVVGGGPFTGAPYYAAVGAYRTGADLVECFVPGKAAEHVRGYGPEPIVAQAGADDYLTMAGAATVIEALAGVGCVVIGPGLGTHADTLAAATAIIEACWRRKIPLVVDADALDALPAGQWVAGTETVLTPHGREFADLAGDTSATEYAGLHHCTVLLKGAVDTVASPSRSKYCHRGNPTMTVGGTGDVLAGCVGTLLARGADGFDAACGAAYLLGVAGERAAAELGAGAVALDIADHIPAVLALLE